MQDYGDYIESDYDERAPEFCDIETSAEPIERYVTGCFYPVYIGELLDGRYRIIHKLGRGGFSSVWLAHDIDDGKDVALKIMVAGDVGDYEHKMHTEIQRFVGDVSCFTTCLRFFRLSDHHGRRHGVLVLPVRGPSLEDLACERPIATRMRAARQILCSLASLHRYGIVHRDLNHGSITWGLVPLDESNVDTKYSYLGRPQKIALPKDIWKKGDLVLSIAHHIPESLLEENVYLGDFGMSRKIGDSTRTHGCPPAIYRAPELLHGIDYGTARDMWSYTFIFAELFLGARIWWGEGTATVLSRVVNLLGPLPEDWRGLFLDPSWSDDSWYDQSRKATRGTEPLEAKIRRFRPEVGELERHHFLSVMALGFCYIPENRITAAELLRHESFRAIMDIYKV